MFPDRYFDWHLLHHDENVASPVVDSRRRLRLCLLGFVVFMAIVLGRVVQLEVTQGAAFRLEAAKPLVRRESLPGVRGRILAANGTVLAHDTKVLALAVHYRWLEEPPNPRWLHWTARSRLSPEQRKNRRRVAVEEDQIRIERIELAKRLAQLSGISIDQWNRRSLEIQARVERIAENVNHRHLRPEPGSLEDPASDESDATRPESLFGRVGSLALDVLRASMDDAPQQRITVAEELDYHVIVDNVSLAVFAEVEGDSRRYPGVKTVQRRRRAYPAGSSAAHVLGHLGDVEPDEVGPNADSHFDYHPLDRVGRMGVERGYEHILRGSRGIAVDLTDRGGRVISSHRQIEPGIGRDLVLTIDSRLQQNAESLLKDALDRRAIGNSGNNLPEEPAGGAIVVMDVHSGAILTAASAPRFDPNLFAGGDAAELNALFSEPARPLFDRVSKMAIPPGSVFKTVTAAALLEAGGLEPREQFFCQGYLHQPDSLRCDVYRRHGVGHGQVTLCDSLAQSCNVYFFHHAGRLGAGGLTKWAWRFGFGQPTGVDLPDEAAGTLPLPATIPELEGHAWRTADTQALAIGQSSLEATPLQIVRMMAAVANGGLLVTPHLASRLGLPELAEGQSTAELSELTDDPIQIPPPTPIPGLEASALATIREGLERVVSDPDGTAHGSVRLDSIPIAGKTGTAQTGSNRSPHAWFAGYVPADKPKFAFVVVLEHSGDAGEVAGPVAKRLVLRMQQLGYIGP